jgi:hypothetical protein
MTHARDPEGSVPADDIHDVKRRHSTRVMGLPGVCGFGVERDEHGADVLVIHVKAGHAGGGSRFPREIEGYPVRVVESGPFRAAGG